VLAMCFNSSRTFPNPGQSSSPTKTNCRCSSKHLSNLLWCAAVTSFDLILSDRLYHKQRTLHGVCEAFTILRGDHRVANIVGDLPVCDPVACASAFSDIKVLQTDSHYLKLAPLQPCACWWSSTSEANGVSNGLPLSAITFFSFLGNMAFSCT
jgi:hypothetical protein